MSHLLLVYAPQSAAERVRGVILIARVGDNYVEYQHVPGRIVNRQRRRHQMGRLKRLPEVRDE